MEKRGPDFYDTEHVFQSYSRRRSQPQSANETIEQPILWDLIGDPKGLSVLDLGCGDARVAKKFKSLGAQDYLGIDGSNRMHALAAENVEPGFSKVQRAWLEDFVPPNESFDLVTSSLVFHYLEDLNTQLDRIYRTLKPNGHLVFSVEHPVITSCNQSLESSALRQDWVVDEYFVRGRRSVAWLDDHVAKYHRTCPIAEL